MGSPKILDSISVQIQFAADQTNYIEISTNREAIICAATQELSSIYGIRRFIIALTRAVHWSLLSQINPVHITPSYLSKIHLNVIHQLHFPGGLFLSSFPTNNLQSTLLGFLTLSIIWNYSSILCMLHNNLLLLNFQLHLLGSSCQVLIKPLIYDTGCPVTEDSSKGPNRVGLFVPICENRNRSSFWNAVFYIFRIPGDGQSPEQQEFSVLYTIIRIIWILITYMHASSPNHAIVPCPSHSPWQFPAEATNFHLHQRHTLGPSTSYQMCTGLFP
jgi:hypothetical protein